MPWPAATVYVLHRLGLPQQGQLLPLRSTEFTGKAVARRRRARGLHLGRRQVRRRAYVRNITNQVRVVGGIDFNNLTGFINEPRTLRRRNSRRCSEEPDDPRSGLAAASPAWAAPKRPGETGSAFGLLRAALHPLAACGGLSPRGWFPAVVLTAAAAGASAAPAVIYELGGKFDKFLQPGRLPGRRVAGSSRPVKPYLEFEDRKTRRSANRRRGALPMRGANPIVGDRLSAWPAAIETVAKEFPATAVCHHRHGGGRCPTCRVLSTANTKAAFLVGMMAALASKTGTRWVLWAGMDIPLVRKFLCGYEQGARHGRCRRVQVISSMTGAPRRRPGPTRHGAPNSPRRRSRRACRRGVCGGRHHRPGHHAGGQPTRAS
jgi:hypothetical protein